MASKKDMRRPDLVVPYVAPSGKDKESDMSGTFASTLPMAAMFTRNKMIGWTSLIFALQNWLAETPDQKNSNSTPGYMSVGMSFMAVIVTYLPMFLPPPPNVQRAGSGTEAPPAAPPS